jgi:cobalt/nickel transport system permease protein
MIYIDKYSNFSKLRELNPIVKAGYFAVFLAGALLSASLLFTAILIVCISCFNLYYSSLKPVHYLKLSLIPLGFVLLGIIPILFTEIKTGETVVLNGGMFNYGITHNTLIACTKVVLRSYAATSALFFLVLTTPVSHLMWLLRKCRFPELLIDLTGLIYRNIFIVLQLSQQLYTAQKCRLAYAGSRNRNNHLGLLLSRTFVLSIKKANDQYNGLESRCYNNHFKPIAPEFFISQFYVIQLLLVSFGISSTYFISYYYQWQ